jgi:hypothetical protein
MRRREFIAGLGSTAAWPVVVRAQQGGRVRRMGHCLDKLLLNPRGYRFFLRYIGFIGVHPKRKITFSIRHMRNLHNQGARLHLSARR